MRLYASYTYGRMGDEDSESSETTGPTNLVIPCASQLLSKYHRLYQLESLFHLSMTPKSTGFCFRNLTPGPKHTVHFLRCCDLHGWLGWWCCSLWATGSYTGWERWEEREQLMSGGDANLCRSYGNQLEVALKQKKTATQKELPHDQLDNSWAYSQRTPSHQTTEILVYVYYS